MQQPLRHTGIEHDLRQLVAHRRGTFRGLEQNRIACDQGRRHHTGGDRQREIPWSNHHGHAARTPQHLIEFTGITAQTGRRIESCHFAGVILQKIDRLRDIGIGLPPGFAFLEHFPRCQIPTLLPHQGGSLPHHRDTVSNRSYTPGLFGGLGNLGKRRDIGRLITLYHRDELIRPTGIIRRQIRPRWQMSRDLRQVESFPQLLAAVSDRISHGNTDGRTRKICNRFVHKFLG